MAAICCLFTTTRMSLTTIESCFCRSPHRIVPTTVAGHAAILLFLLECLNQDGVAAVVPNGTQYFCSVSPRNCFVSALWSH